MYSLDMCMSNVKIKTRHQSDWAVTDFDNSAKKHGAPMGSEQETRYNKF